jgi:hypothetical protein
MREKNYLKPFGGGLPAIDRFPRVGPVGMFGLVMLYCSQASVADF